MQDQNSCCEPILKDERYIHCDKCDKCMRIAAVMTALGVDCKKYGLTYKPEVFTKAGEKIFNSQDALKESQTLAYLIDKKGLLPKDSIIKPKFHFVTLDLEFDGYHPMILPPQIYSYLKDTFMKVRRDLNVE